MWTLMQSVFSVGDLHEKKVASSGTATDHHEWSRGDLHDSHDAGKKWMRWSESGNWVVILPFYSFFFCILRWSSSDDAVPELPNVQNVKRNQHHKTSSSYEYEWLQSNFLHSNTSKRWSVELMLILLFFNTSMKGSPFMRHYEWHLIPAWSQDDHHHHDACSMDNGQKEKKKKKNGMQYNSERENDDSEFIILSLFLIRIIIDARFSTWIIIIGSRSEVEFHGGNKMYKTSQCHNNSRHDDQRDIQMMMKMIDFFWDSSLLKLMNFFLLLFSIQLERMMMKRSELNEILLWSSWDEMNLHHQE